VFFTDKDCKNEQSEYSIIYNEDYPLTDDICFKLKSGAASLYVNDTRKLSFGPGYAYLLGEYNATFYLWKFDYEVKDKDCKFRNVAPPLDRVQFKVN